MITYRISSNNRYPARIQTAARKGTTVASSFHQHEYANSTIFYNTMKNAYLNIQRIIADFLDKLPEKINLFRSRCLRIDFKAHHFPSSERILVNII